VLLCTIRSHYVLPSMARESVYNIVSIEKIDAKEEPQLTEVALLGSGTNDFYFFSLLIYRERKKVGSRQGSVHTTYALRQMYTQFLCLIQSVTNNNYYLNTFVPTMIPTCIVNYLPFAICQVFLKKNKKNKKKASRKLIWCLHRSPSCRISCERKIT